MDASVTVDALPQPAASTGRRVLVVEDEPHIRELVVLHIKLEGLDVVEAKDGDEAIRLIRSQSFDLCVLDLMLPRVDGLAVCRAIRREPPNADTPMGSHEVSVSLTLGTKKYVLANTTAQPLAMARALSAEALKR